MTKTKDIETRDTAGLDQALSEESRLTWPRSGSEEDRHGFRNAINGVVQ